MTPNNRLDARSARLDILTAYLLPYYLSGKHNKIKNQKLFISASELPEDWQQELRAQKASHILFSKSEVLAAKQACSQELYGTDNPPLFSREFFFTLMHEHHEAGSLSLLQAADMPVAEELRLFSTAHGKFLTVPRKLVTEWRNQQLGTTRSRGLENKLRREIEAICRERDEAGLFARI